MFLPKLQIHSHGTSGFLFNPTGIFVPVFVVISAACK